MTFIEQYSQLVKELISLRENADGNLPADVEEDYACKLNDLRRNMNEIKEAEIPNVIRKVKEDAL